MTSSVKEKLGYVAILMAFFTPLLLAGLWICKIGQEHSSRKAEQDRQLMEIERQIADAKRENIEFTEAADAWDEHNQLLAQDIAAGRYLVPKTLIVKAYAALLSALAHSDKGEVRKLLQQAIDEVATIKNQGGPVTAEQLQAVQNIMEAFIPEDSFLPDREAASIPDFSQEPTTAHDLGNENSFESDIEADVTGEWEPPIYEPLFTDDPEKEREYWENLSPEQLEDILQRLEEEYRELQEKLQEEPSEPLIET